MANLRDELQKIYDQRGRLTPALVVEEATDNDHPLHSHFVWDNNRAGHLYREERARELIRSVKVVFKTKEASPQMRTVRQWYAIATPAGHEFEPLEKVTSDPVLIEVVRYDMERQWRALKARFENFEEFWVLVQEDLSKKISA